MLLEEYILSYDELEAGECIKELKAPEYHYKVVSKVPHPLVLLFASSSSPVRRVCLLLTWFLLLLLKAVAKAIERKEEQRKLISKLLFQLHTEQNVLSAESIAQGCVTCHPPNTASTPQHNPKQRCRTNAAASPTCSRPSRKST